MRSYKLVSLVLLSVVACKKNKAADNKETPAPTPKIGATVTTGSDTPAPTPTAPAPSGKPFEATFEGKPVKFGGARIEYQASHDVLKLTTSPLPCDRFEPDATDVILEITVPAGPGGKHYAGEPIEIGATLYSGKQEFVIGNDDLDGTLTMQPGEWKAGNKIKANIHLDATDDDKKQKYTADGVVEATVCDLSAENRYAGSPETADNSPASGSFAGTNFTVKSAFADIQNNEKGDRITMIELYDSALDCKSRSGQKGMLVIIGGDDGASQKNTVIGKARPRAISYRLPNDGAQHFIGNEAWVKFDAIDLKYGGEIKGSVYGEANPSDAKADPKKAAKISGTFTAKLCE